MQCHISCIPPPAVAIELKPNPSHHDNNFKPLPFSTLPLETPHAILVTIPIRATRNVHPPFPATALFAGEHVLDYTCVDDEFVGWGLGLALSCGCGRCGGFGD
jgi:hypothetical protein